MLATATTIGLLAFAAAEAAPVAVAEEYLLIRRDQDAWLHGRSPTAVYPVRLVEVDDRTLVHGDADRGYRSVPLSRVVGLLAADALPAVSRTGLLRLSDGQRFPGEAFSGARAAADVLVWNQSAWLGRMEVPLDRIESVVFRPGTPVPEPGDEDVVLLGNGDQLDGFVTALGDPLVIDLAPERPGDERLTLEIALDRVAAVRMVAPRRPAHGTRVWLIDGTVVDVARLLMGDDGVVRLDGVGFVTDLPPKRLERSALVAAQFDSAGLVPFAALAPRSIQGPASRYVVRAPQALEELAPLGLARVELRGPIVARYSLPAFPVLLSAEASLPFSARSWGDCELIIRSDRREVFRVHLTGRAPTAQVSVLLEGGELEIEVTEGAHGPIHDHVVLHRAMLLQP